MRACSVQRQSQIALQSLSAADAANAVSATGEGLLRRMAPPGFRPSGLDNLLCYSHYVVHQVGGGSLGRGALCHGPP